MFGGMEGNKRIRISDSSGLGGSVASAGGAMKETTPILKMAKNVYDTANADLYTCPSGDRLLQYFVCRALK